MASTPSAPRVPWVLIALLAAIALITLTPRVGPVPGSTLCLICGSRGAADALLNLVMFAPLGAWIVARRGGSVLWAGLLGLALSGAIEVAQLALPGRDASAGDILFNASGALLGAGGLRGLAWLRRRGPAWPAFTLALLASTVLWAGSWLLAPQVPESRWWGQWTADTGQRIYNGRVLEAAIGAQSVAGGRELETTPAIRAELRRGRRLQLRLIAGEAPDAEAPILGIYDEAQREVLLFGAIGQDAFLRYYTRGRRFRFDRPALRFGQAFTGVAPGDTMALAVQPRGSVWGGGTCLTYPRLRDRVCARYTPATTWSLLMPVAGGSGRVLELAWIFALFLPAGLFVSSAGRARVAGLVASAAAGLFAAAAFPAVGLPTAAEVALVCAAAAGPAIVRRFSPLRRALR